MELSQFIKNASHFLEQPENSVIVFQGSSYSHSFFTQLFDRIKLSFPLDFKTIDIQSGDFSYKSQLETSFLGMGCVYWLGDVASLKPKQKDECIKYLTSYQGPHKVMIFVDAKTEIAQGKKITVVTVKDKYFFEDAKLLWATQDMQQAQKIAAFLHQLYKIKTSFTLDELFLLKNYQDLITTDSKEFYESWVTRLVTADTSLFTLSQLLFEKKEEAFFRLWLQIQSLYAEMFWISFLSDQLYRSYFFIAFTQEENFAAAKQVSFGLSFSFMKQSYKQYQLIELQNFHQAIFAVDTALKNGGNMHQIDQLFVDFFSNKFKNQNS
ncbi:hypothetical protein KBC04_01375 [Candidatus Babeliales bacterium]|nr:hypothetical protein [Candidatus Babeliales bacterium]MBP9843629.1 hypothetical protein [Candidatus Babeliales bacterium]